MAKFQVTLVGDLIEGTATKVDTRTITADDSGITEYLSNVFTVPTGQTDLLITLGNIDTTKHLLVEVGGTCSIKLNSNAATAIPFTPAAGKVGLLALSAGAVTQLYVTNTSGATVTLKVMAAG